MSNDAPPEYGGGGNSAQDYDGYHRRGVNTLLIFAIAVFAVMSFYLWLVVATRVDGVLFPGNDLSLGVGGVNVPGTGGGSPEVATPEQRINILVMGLDQRLDERDGQPSRTDSVVIFSIDPYTKTAGAFSIPRDTRVEIPDGDGGVYTSTRINEAYEMGEFGVNGFPSESYGKGGAALAMETIKWNFDISIDYYVILNWANFIKIVDDLGGITIDVPEYVYDPAYSTCTFCGEYYPVEFEPGVQDMDGPRALEYARLRKSDNDYKRIERQQLVMRAIAVKATSLNLLDIGKAKSLYDTYKSSIQTNVPDTQLPGLARLGGQVGLANVRMVSAGPAMYPCPASICGNAAMLLWNEQTFNELKALVFSDQRVVNEGAIIDVLNGTATRGLAGTFAGQMALEGISRIDMKTNEWADGPPWPTTQIIDVTGTKSQTIVLLQEKLDLPDARVLRAADIPTLAPELEEFLDTASDIIVVLGEDHNVDTSFGDVYIEPAPYVPEPEPEPEPTFSEPEPTEPEATLPPEEPTPTDPPAETEVPQ